MFLQLLVVLSSGLLCLSQQHEDEVYTTCKEILAKFPDTPSGDYVLAGSTEKVYCDMENNRCGSQGWTRVAYVNMSSETSSCPESYHLYQSPIRSCGGKPNQCIKATFSTHGITYSQVCGRIIGYQVGHTNGFGPYRSKVQLTDALDGVLISHGEKKEHIWAFVTGFQRKPTKGTKHTYICPCASYLFNGIIPPFLGNDYYCDSGVDSEPTEGKFYTNPLWIGERCEPPNFCCSLDSQPWFCKTLADPTSDEIDVYNCNNESSGEDTAVQLIELYVH